ncbi:MAG TPA: VWA domain-containing protein [Thermoanaerobaculia bacterium]|nr:VWA domain-containing protein [Thermoanaerobaculia bacterium]
MRGGFLLLALLAAPSLAAALPLVTIIRPTADQPLFGETEVLVDARPGGSPVRQVELYFDSLRVGSVEAPPYKFVVDAGQENKTHRIEAVAHDDAGATATASLTTPVLRVDMQIDVRLQQLFVSVEHATQPDARLGRDDFIILDDGEPQTLSTFEQGDVPFNAVLLLDASTSMEKPQLDTAVDGVRSFTRAMSRLDETKLLVFTDHVLVETPFTNLPSILTLGLSDVQAQGGTALHDALYLGLKRLEDRPGRKIAILLSDGLDIESVVPMQTVRAVARRSQTVLYWLRLRPPGEDKEKGPLKAYYTAWRDAEGNRRALDDLRAAVLESGGRIDTLQGIEEVPAVLARILKELRGQYVLGFSPTVHHGPGAWHKIEVQVRDAPEAKVRVQEGYVER